MDKLLKEFFETTLQYLAIDWRNSTVKSPDVLIEKAITEYEQKIKLDYIKKSSLPTVEEIESVMDKAVDSFKLKAKIPFKSYIARVIHARVHGEGNEIIGLHAPPEMKIEVTDTEWIGIPETPPKDKLELVPEQTNKEANEEEKE